MTHISVPRQRSAPKIRSSQQHVLRRFDDDRCRDTGTPIVGMASDVVPMTSWCKLFDETARRPCRQANESEHDWAPGHIDGWFRHACCGPTGDPMVTQWSRARAAIAG
jgi:hypothetical protein